MARALSSVLMLALLVGCSFLGSGSVDFDTDTILMDGVSTAIFTIRNGGHVATPFTIEDDVGWLQAVPPAGEIGAFQSQDVLIFVDRASVPVGSFRPLERSPGTYEATLFVLAGEVEAAVELRFRVGSDPTESACTTSILAASASGAHGDRPASAGAPPATNAHDALPSSVIVRYADPIGPTGSQDARGGLERLALDIAAAYGLQDRRPGPGSRVEVARIPEGVDPHAFADALAADPRVAYAELDRPLYPQDVLPDDPALPLQWAPCRFGAPGAWSVSTGAALAGSDAPKTTIAILDSGVDLDHPDLQASLLPGRDFCPLASASTTSCTSVPSEPGGGAVGDGHGTHVAGIAAAVGDNGTGIAGVAWGGTKLLPVKVFDDPGSVTSVATVACAIYWAFGSTDPATLCGAPPNPHPAAILNLSLGGSGSSPTLDDAISAATRAGALVFAASGNAEGGPAYDGILMPANAPDAIAVGSVNSNFERSSFSRFDALGGRTVDLMAPGGYLLANGDQIYSTYVNSAGTSTYFRLAGTSMATPYAAGVAALVWAHEPSSTAEQVRKRLEATTHVSPSWTEEEYGAGLVCADAALGRAATCGASP